MCGVRSFSLRAAEVLEFGCTAVWTFGARLSCTLKNDKDGKFHAAGFF